MCRPWQIWLLYFLGLVGLGGALSWLTVKALEIDRAESLARRQAELEEDITAALWRMDSILTPLLAEEAARPYQVYRTVYMAEDGDKAADVRELSPLLLSPPPHAVLHFEMAADGRITSPQCPTGDDRAWALDHGASVEAIETFSARLAELHSAVAFPQLLVQCSPSLPVESSSNGAMPGGLQAQPLTQAFNSPSILNPYEDAVQQQLRILNSTSVQQSGGQTIFPNANTPTKSEDLQQLEPRPQAAGSQQEFEPALNFGNNSVESGRVARPQTRAGNDLAKRDAALQQYAQKAFDEQRANLKGGHSLVRIVEGASRPLWMGDRLLIARRVQSGSNVVVQGCWLDWNHLKNRLKAEVADVLPEVELTAVAADRPIKLSRLLATLPVQLAVPPLAALPAVWTPLRASLAVGWFCLLVTAAAAALMLHSVVALSERRGAFVSAVTHELRTPLTTFRMYAEMLSAGMVPDAAQRQKYLETLKTEADRLAHLVENVLQYARLERGRPGKQREEVTLAQLLERCQSRLADRTAQAEMKLDLHLATAHREVSMSTDAAAVEQILFNLVDNACKYAAEAANRRIEVSLLPQPRSVRLVVRDYGPGISLVGRKKLFRPFSKSVHEAASTAPGVGLGLALSRRLAAELGGRLELQSPEGGGAAFVLTLPR